MRLELVGIALGSGLTQGVHRVLGHDGEDDFAVVVGAAGESRCFHITYRTHGRGQLFRRKLRHAWLLRCSPYPPCSSSQSPNGDTCASHIPRDSCDICGLLARRRADPTSRAACLGSQVPQIDQEICIWGYDVANKNPPPGDPAPKGITGYAIAPVASIACAKVIECISGRLTASAR